MDGRFADAVIVAAGASTRMGGVDKLSAPLLGRPLLAWSVESMAYAETVRRVVLVVRQEQVKKLAGAKWLARAADDRLTIVAGGERRSESVRAGVDATDAAVVLVHDGARPLASRALADMIALTAAEEGAAAPFVPIVDSLKRVVDERIEASLDREGVVRTQTPQGARRGLLLDAFARTTGRGYTDEAALLEANGVPVTAIPGEASNVKVTNESDLELVRALAAFRAGKDVRKGADIRFGFGVDSHGFGPEDGLILGGVLIDTAPRLYGHSDGDVVLHALATAVLAACGLGDLGRLFPSSDPESEGVSSRALLAEVLEMTAGDGWRVARAQVALVGARPRLGGRRIDEIRGAISGSLGVRFDSVSVTASTGNLYGPEGAGLVIRATALVTVIRR